MKITYYKYCDMNRTDGITVHRCKCEIVKENKGTYTIKLLQLVREHNINDIINVHKKNVIVKDKDEIPAYVLNQLAIN